MGGAACAKIIINGRRSLATIEEIVAEAIKARDNGTYFHGDDEIVVLFNEIEDAADKAAKAYLEGQGFKGPWPRSMKDD